MSASIARHNPPSVWSRPEQFRTIYSHAAEVTAATRLLFISGQIGVAPDGTTQAGFAKQCEQAMDNVEALLSEAKMTTGDIVKITYLLTRAGDMATLGEIRRRRWSSAEPPAVTTFVVSALARPELLIEVEVTVAAP